MRNEYQYKNSIRRIPCFVPGGIRNVHYKLVEHKTYITADDYCQQLHRKRLDLLRVKGVILQCYNARPHKAKKKKKSLLWDVLLYQLLLTRFNTKRLLFVSITRTFQKREGTQEKKNVESSFSNIRREKNKASFIKNEDEAFSVFNYIFLPEVLNEDERCETKPQIFISESMSEQWLFLYLTL